MTHSTKQTIDFKYRIIEIDPDNNSMVVRYFTDNISENYLATYFNDDGSIRMTDKGYPIRCATDFNICFFDNYNPSENVIIEKIKDAFNFDWFYMKENTITGNISINLSNVYAMTDKVNTVSGHTKKSIKDERDNYLFIANSLHEMYPGNDIVLEIKPTNSSQTNIVSITTTVYK